MQYRSKHLTSYCFLIGVIVFLVGFNFVAYNRILYLEKCLCQNNSWLTASEFYQMEKEIDRLDKETKSVLKKK